MRDDRCDLLCLDLEKAERLRHERLDPERAARLADQARALADPTRLIVATAPPSLAAAFAFLQRVHRGDGIDGRASNHVP